MNLTQKELRLIMQKPPGALTAEDLRWLDPRHIPSLSPRHVASLTTSELLGMSPKQLGALTQEQVAVLTLEQMGLVPASVKRRERRLAVLAEDGPARLRMHLEHRVDALPHGAHFGAFRNLEQSARLDERLENEPVEHRL